MCEPDRDVIRWNLHLLQPDMFSNSTCCGDQNDDDAQYAEEGSKNTNSGSVENDEVIARALQEELSQIALEEAKGPSNVADERLQASILAQDWLSFSTDESQSDTEPLEVSKDVETSSSSSVSVESSDNGEEGLLQLENEFDEFDNDLEGEVCKRLNQMTPVPHVPKTNGDIPSDDEAISDHQRLLDRLSVYDLFELKVQGDGNCQFRALSDQFYRTPEHHEFVRLQIVGQLKSHPEIYEGYVPMDYDDYLEKISKNGEWGDHVTLQAAADSYGVKIFILTSFKDTCYIEILPNVQKSKRVIFLSFWAEVHYNSIYPEGEFPICEAKKKRRWWRFGM